MRVSVSDSRPVAHHKQPPRQPFFSSVQAVASGDLAHRKRLVLHKLKDPVSDFFRGPEHFTEMRQPDSGRRSL